MLGLWGTASGVPLHRALWRDDGLSLPLDRKNSEEPKSQANSARSRLQLRRNGAGGFLQLIAFNHLSSEGRAIFLPATGWVNWIMGYCEQMAMASVSLCSCMANWGFWRLPPGHCHQLAPRQVYVRGGTTTAMLAMSCPCWCEKASQWTQAGDPHGLQALLSKAYQDTWSTKA